MAVSDYLIVAIFLVVAVLLSIRTGKLTAAGGLTGGTVGLLVFAGFGYIGLSILTVFFISGTLATSWKKQDKIRFKAQSDQSASRNAGQVLANGGVAAIMGLLAIFIPQQTYLLGLMMAGALASATADTLSSELGMVYGRSFFNIITLKKETKGLDGVISLEGLLIGIIGSALIAAIYSQGHLSHMTFIWIICAGTIGNLADSVLGAVFERKGGLNNDSVNFLNTLIAALSVLAFVSLAW
ncbi:DUF92 domain-containing protein [Mucilaginibacter ginsenosidivorans]|uniref:DUF92 domain-containing protein n=1 Tax=Mucilaginibacter ginsenosidivorans TaxID=398053 RepID=A0A5B8UY94_9SPHI|nr:DUF92 domain-containing protein [Mucilaginibacter ginsenosidivorans]QEC64080.1 DUF92 domain-containing protein [Mucilaginibacter ginsenosidivorans]